MRIALIAAVLLACGHIAMADESRFDPAQHMRTADVRPGMTGYGLSVFSGTKIERFEVEVISVLKNQMGPKQDVVLIRCRGQGLEHSGSIAGMSGSPIFLTGSDGKSKMIGAFALGWEGAKDPIAGVRPIEEMLAVPTEPKPVDKPAIKVSASMWDARDLIAGLSASAKPTSTAAATNSATLRPLTLPLSIGGADERFVNSVLPLANRAGFTLLAAAGNAEAPADADIKNVRLERGSAIGVPIVSGDLNLAAVGTVTEVIGNDVYAFGHEFIAEGATALPMGVGYIHSVIASQSLSFKLGTLLRTDGTITHDESVAIAGRTGAAPAMIPVSITVATPQRPAGQTYQYSIVRHPVFTPMGCAISVSSAMTGHSQFPADFTVDYDLNLQFDGGRSIRLRNSTGSLTQADELVRDLQLPITLAMENPFERVYPSGITGTMTIRDTADMDVVRTIRTDRTIYRPGDVVKLFVTTRAWKGAERTRAVEFELPGDLPDGPCSLTAADASRYVLDETRYAPYRYVAEGIEDVFKLTKALTQADSRSLYVRLVSRREGVSVGAVPLDRLPASRRQILSHPGRADVLAFTPTLTKTYAWDRMLSGAVELDIVIARDPSKAGRPPVAAPALLAPVAPQPPDESNAADTLPQS